LRLPGTGRQQGPVRRKADAVDLNFLLGYAGSTCQTEREAKKQNELGGNSHLAHGSGEHCLSMLGFFISVAVERPG